MLLLLSVCWFSATPMERGQWSALSDDGGVKIERRTVAGFAYYEYRVSAAVHTPLERVKTYLWGEYLHAARPKITRSIVREAKDEIVLHDVFRTPVVSDRDYVVRFRRLDDAQTRVFQVLFSSSTEGPPSAPGCVRIPFIEGAWTLEPGADGGTEINYVVLSDVGGSVPAFLAHAGQRDAAADLVRSVIEKTR